jgi:hypothetical protein
MHKILVASMLPVALAAGSTCFATSGAAQTSRVPAWAIGTWLGTLRGSLAHYYSGNGLDRKLTVGADGNCTFGPPQYAGAGATCSFSADAVNVATNNGSHAYFQYRKEQLDGVLDGNQGGRVFLTMSKQ